MRPGSVAAARGTILSALLVTASVVVALVLCGSDGVPGEWRVIAVLAAVAIAGIVAGQMAGHSAPSASQPWNVHSIWLVPAILLTPPIAFGTLIALSLATTLLPTSKPLRGRLLVALNTLLGSALLDLAVEVTDSPRSALIVGMPLLLAATALMAALGSRLIQAEPAPSFFTAYHRAAIEMSAALTGCLITVAMAGHPVAGLAGIAPTVLAVFALRWPALASQARTDTKTGLPNAGRWEELSRQALSDCARRHRPAALLIVDIDHFKMVNDNYGHLAGDGILAAVATAISAELGGADLVGRFGGEEFVVTTIGLNERQALDLAERIRRRIASTSHEVITREGVRLTAGPVTCTIGVASSERLGYEHTTLMRRADAALASGKSGGRNQVRRASPAEVTQASGRSATSAAQHPNPVNSPRVAVQERAAESSSVDAGSLSADDAPTTPGHGWVTIGTTRPARLPQIARISLTILRSTESADRFVPTQRLPTSRDGAS